MTTDPHISSPSLADARTALAHLLAPFATPGFAPDAQTVEPDAIPEPSRSLLVHSNHMTLELQRRFGSPVQVHVQRESHAGDLYTRKIALTLAGTNRCVEWGIARLDLRFLAPQVRADILAKKLPLGAVLIGHRVHRRVEPIHYIRFPAHSPALRLFSPHPNPDPLFARIGIIHCDNEPAIELLEIVVDTELH